MQRDKESAPHVYVNINRQGPSAFYIDGIDISGIVSALTGSYDNFSGMVLVARIHVLNGTVTLNGTPLFDSTDPI